MQDTRSAFRLYLIENGANIVIALALFGWLGVQGLALSLSIAYTLGTVAAVADMRKRAAGVIDRALVRSIVRITGVTAVMAVVVAIVAAAIGSGNDAHQALRVGAAIGVGATVYLVVARIVGVDELSALLQLRRRSESPTRPPTGPTG